MRHRLLILPKPILGILVLLSGITLWTLVVSLFGDYAPESSYKLVSSLENYIQPIAVIALVLCWTSFGSYTELSGFFNRLCRVFILLLCLNSLLAILSIFFDLYFVVRPFVESCFGSTSVAQEGMTMGRYSGIFNQPFESGVAYSLGVLSWGYLARIHARNRCAGYKLFLLTVGGVLSVSKVFILGGIPLFLLYWNPLDGFKKYLNWRFVLATMIGYCTIVLMIKFWAGWAYFSRLFTSGEGNTDLIALYTAGRFGIQDSNVQSTFAKVWQEAPLQGFGFGASSLLDNGYLEFFLQGGMVALFGYFALLAIFFCCGLRGFLNGHEGGRLLLAYFILVVGSSLGAGVLTINRFSTVFWVLTTFLFLILQAQRRDKVKNRIILNHALRAG
jgi:hypothetical protein